MWVAEEEKNIFVQLHYGGQMTSDQWRQNFQWRCCVNVYVGDVFVEGGEGVARKTSRR